MTDLKQALTYKATYIVHGGPFDSTKRTSSQYCYTRLRVLDQNAPFFSKNVPRIWASENKSYLEHKLKKLN